MASEDSFRWYLARSVVDLKQRLEKDDSLVEAVKADLAAQIQSSESNLTKAAELKKRTANKDFITGRLVNWTLSDTLNRIVINVGVAYGSDVQKTKQILHKVCQDHPKTVNDPPTRVAFEAFGDSSLNFVIRTFITEIDSRLLVIDDLHTQIDEAFRKAGVVIAFPQRDLHLCSIDQEATDSIRGVKRIVDVKDE